MVPLRAAVAAAVLVALYAPAAAQWRADIVAVPGRVSAVDPLGYFAIESRWYRLASPAGRVESVAAPGPPTMPGGALPDGHIAVGPGTIARAWLAEPTTRYGHGVLGDAIEAGSLVVERRDGQQAVLRLSHDAVFEDLAPRVVTIDGAERIVVVKSYLEHGAALAVVDEDATIVAETPPIGRPNAWLNPAGIADYDGDGVTDIALVRQPHVVGRLELWSFRRGQLRKTLELGDVSNHFIGSRALALSATADFDGDGRSDLAVPSLDRRSLRIIGFTPQPRDITRVTLPARLATNIGRMEFDGRIALVAGLENGDLVLIHD